MDEVGDESVQIPDVPIVTDLPDSTFDVDEILGIPNVE
jgi:hypothetical protein